MEKVLLDTDIGSDIDDAVCLAYLLAQPQCDLLGITTVTGEGSRRAALASALCQVAGRDVPIYVGAEQPLLVEPRQPQAPQAAALGRWPHESDFETGEAIEFLRETIHLHPGEVTLLTIGPLTNAALLFAVDPDIPALLKRLVIMGGSFAPGIHEEWNLLLDPHAATMVFRAPTTETRVIGLDVTHQVQLPAAEVRARFTHPLLRPVLDFAEVWFAERDIITFHDPLAAATIFAPQLCSYESGRVTEVQMADGPGQGKVQWQPEADGPHRAAMTVDAAGYFAHFFSQFA